MGAKESKLMLCGLPGCTLPCHDDGRIVYEFCGRVTHPKQAASSGLIADGRRSQTGTTCQLHGCSRPRFFDSAKKLVHDFCSKSHAEEPVPKDSRYTRVVAWGSQAQASELFSERFS
ncbi:unnamed protein product [Ectocarpus sp. 4 AP-2014]